VARSASAPRTRLISRTTRGPRGGQDTECVTRLGAPKAAAGRWASLAGRDGTHNPLAIRSPDDVDAVVARPEVNSVCRSARRRPATQRQPLLVAGELGSERLSRRREATLPGETVIPYAAGRRGAAAATDSDSTKTGNRSRHRAHPHSAIIRQADQGPQSAGGRVAGLAGQVLVLHLPRVVHRVEGGMADEASVHDRIARVTSPRW
jgi:hypothetical protein